MYTNNKGAIGKGALIIGIIFILIAAGLIYKYILTDKASQKTINSLNVSDVVGSEESIEEEDTTNSTSSVGAGAGAGRSDGSEEIDEDIQDYVEKASLNAIEIDITTFGGNEDDNISEIVVDSEDNMYIAGNFEGELIFGNTRLTSEGSNDIYITKVSQDGEVIWTKNIGGPQAKSVSSIALDQYDNLYLGGYFDAKIAMNGKGAVSNGKDDGYIIKLNTDGDAVWVKGFGGKSSERVGDISIGLDGNVYATGYFGGTALFRNISLKSNGKSDIFTAKLTPDGDFTWVKSIGGDSVDIGVGVVADISGNTYMAGYFSNDLKIGDTTYSPSGDTTDVIVLRMDNSGEITNVQQISSESRIRPTGIGVDNEGNTFTTGFFSGSATIGDTSLLGEGSSDIFVLKLLSDGNKDWIKNFGGSASDVPGKVYVDTNNDLYVTGYFGGYSTQGIRVISSNGKLDSFITKINGDGEVQWSENIGSLADDKGVSVTTLSDGNVVVSGTFGDNLKFGDQSFDNKGGADIFIGKVNKDSIN